MAGGDRGDGERQFLALIRDFASERSQGEKRVSDLRRRLQDLLSDFDAATAELEKAKCCKEEALRDLKGAEVEHSIANASVLAHETRIRSLQDEIAKVGDSVAALKEYHEASIACEEIPEVLSNTETSKFLAESIIEEMKKLQELGEQISEAETIYANLGEELRKRYTCPRCGINMATIIEEGG